MSIFTFRKILILLALLLVPIIYLPGQKPDADLAAALRSLDSGGVYGLCRKLAEPEFSGRLTGDAGYTAAAHWIAGRFKQWGLKPLDSAGTYLLPFPTEYTTVEAAEMILLASAGKTETRLELGKDFLPLLFADSGNQMGEAVFAGWGISAPDLGYDDYAGLDLKGKFVVCFRGTPDPSNSSYTPYDEHRTRMQAAKSRGALGLVYIYSDPIANPNGDWLAGFMPAVISDKIADLILKERSIQVARLREDLSRYKRPISFPMGIRLRLSVKSTHVPAGTGYNVAGVIEGSDPSLRDEYVILGAHADHCGTHAGILFPGADDNASGTAVVMEIARTLAQLPKKPARSVVLALFGGEEAGLKGSEHFAAHMPERPRKPVGMLNFDMVGEGDGMSCGYSAASPELEKVVRESDAGIRILRSAHPIRGVGVRGSDFAPFFAKGIPCLSFASNGPHLSYHQAGDTIFRINPDMLANAARLGMATAWRLASVP